MSSVVFTDTVWRHRRNVFFVAGAIGIVVIAGFVGAYDAPSKFWQSMLTMLALFAGCQLIGPEFSSGTLQLILAKPVNRSAYLLARFAGVIAAIVAVTTVAMSADVLARRFFSSTRPIAYGEMFSSTVNHALVITLACAVLVLFGSFTRSYANIAIYILGEIGLSLTLALLDMRRRAGAVSSVNQGIQKVLRLVSENIFPNEPPAFDLRFTLLVLGNTAIALFLACLIFRRREVPYGAD